MLETAGTRGSASASRNTGIDHPLEASYVPDTKERAEKILLFEQFPDSKESKKKKSKQACDKNVVMANRDLYRSNEGGYNEAQKRFKAQVTFKTIHCPDSHSMHSPLSGCPVCL